MKTRIVPKLLLPETHQLWLGNCLDLMKSIPDGSVDLILCDLPYGTTKCKWDTIIPFEPLWEQYKRIIKTNGAIVLTASQPFTSALVMSNIKWFKYDWTWKKSKVTNVLNAKKQPLRTKEDILVFCKSTPAYFPQSIVDCNIQWGTGVSKTGKQGLATGKITNTFTGKYTKIATNYPKNIINIASQGNTTHPTQKPVALMEYLVKTYTNEGETVLDNCMGSGTTGVACLNTGRKFIGMELDREYFLAAKERICKHYAVSKR